MTDRTSSIEDNKRRVIWYWYPDLISFTMRCDCTLFQFQFSKQIFNKNKQKNLVKMKILTKKLDKYCHLCQDPSDHWTRNCPTLECHYCLGHSGLDLIFENFVKSKIYCQKIEWYPKINSVKLIHFISRVFRYIWTLF